jgi:cytochrome oxidase assembly protein ShyY1
MYRFLLRPAWLLLHLFVVVLVVAMVSAMFWQLQRLDEKRSRNDEIRSRQDAAAVPIEDLIAPDATTDAGADQRFRPVTATGTYDLEGQVLLRSRDLDGRPGLWVYTPLDLGDGTAVAVNRGWIPVGDETDGSDSPFETPSGPVTVEGLAEQSYPDARPAGERQTTIAHADLDWLDEQVDADLYPVAIQLRAQDPPPVDDLPVILDPPELTEGPHLSYAGQWFLFTLVVVIGYPVLLRRIAQQRAREAAGEAGEGVHPDPVAV